jgi:hypothetical protein
MENDIITLQGNSQLARMLNHIALLGMPGPKHRLQSCRLDLVQHGYPTS